MPNIHKFGAKSMHILLTNWFHKNLLIIMYVYQVRWVLRLSSSIWVNNNTWLLQICNNISESVIYILQSDLVWWIQLILISDYRFVLFGDFFIFDIEWLNLILSIYQKLVFQYYKLKLQRLFCSRKTGIIAFYKKKI